MNEFRTELCALKKKNWRNFAEVDLLPGSEITRDFLVKSQRVGSCIFRNQKPATEFISTCQIEFSKKKTQFPS